MAKQAPSQAKNLRKKLQKREQLILKRLKEAQQAQTKALDRYHRAEERLQKRIDRVQRIEGRLTLVQQQLDELNQSPPAPAVETEMPTWAQRITPSSLDTYETRSITEPTDLVTEARAAAEAAEENTRLAVARAAERLRACGACVTCRTSARCADEEAGCGGRSDPAGNPITTAGASTAVPSDATTFAP